MATDRQPLRPCLRVHALGPIFIDCNNEARLHWLAGILGEGGRTMIPLDYYGFATLFTWFADRYAVCWQLNLP
jgi:predicted 3-demethylubiquinone-9 3-methyltransferase (glyoxalase superfamily)